jgi:adenylate cyclase
VGWLGFQPSPKNPNVCRQCCDGLPPGGAEVEIAVLFADVRGSTDLAERLPATEYAALLRKFYVTATRALIRHDGLIDKLIGDEVMALFIPGVCGPEYRRRAADAGLDLMRTVGYGSRAGPWLPIGVGIHAGTAFVGNVNADAIVDFTALGDAVNVAARLRSEAKAGEVLMSESVFETVAQNHPGVPARSIALRGRTQPVAVRALTP